MADLRGRLVKRFRDFTALSAAFRRDGRASIVSIFAFALPVLAIAVTAVAEIAEVLTARTELQSSVDSAALKGARELGTDQSPATTERARYMADDLATPLKSRWTIQTTALPDAAAGAMVVTQQATRRSLFGNLVPPGGFHLTVTAKATANATLPLCVLTLQTGGSKVLDVQSTSSVTAGGCLVQSDSDLNVATKASLAAGSARSVGSAAGPITPAAFTDAPSVPDPFSTMAINVPTTCTDNGINVTGNTSQTLAAGVHCGNIQLQGNSSLTFAAGEHYFRNATLSATGSTQISGTDVVLILNNGSTLSLQNNAALSLEGRRSGPYAGFVIITDRTSTNTLTLSTKSAHVLLGTVYVPNAILAVTGTSNAVGDNSPWTVVVAKQLQVQGSTSLVINSNYAGTVVPVPTGVGPSGGGSVQLTR